MSPDLGRLEDKACSLRCKRDELIHLRGASDADEVKAVYLIGIEELTRRIYRIDERIVAETTAPF